MHARNNDLDVPSDGVSCSFLFLIQSNQFSIVKSSLQCKYEVKTSKQYDPQEGYERTFPYSGSPGSGPATLTMTPIKLTILFSASLKAAMKRLFQKGFPLDV